MEVEDSDELTYNKLIRDAKKNGYREGAVEGREVNFQHSFDIGYEQGFKNGFLLGLKKGKLRSQEIKEDPLLRMTKRGECVLCQNSTLKEQAINEIITVQNDRIKLIQK